MRQVEIADSDYVRLQKLAIPFVDTPATVIGRLIDQYETMLNAPADQEAPKPNGVTRYSAAQIPPLVHTKLLDAQFAGQKPLKMTWDSLVRMALENVFAHASSVSDLRRLSGANVVEGQKEDEGYKHLREHNFSYQGVSAEDAVNIILRCAKTLNCQVDIEFEWRNKEGAFMPGQRAIVSIEA